MTSPRILVGLIFLIGCAHGVSDPLPSPGPDPDPEPEIHRTVNSDPIIQHCEELDTVEKYGCTVYKLECDHTGTEYYLFCVERPMGEVTNPPLPISFTAMLPQTEAPARP